MSDVDVVVIGGGLVGASVAYGMVRRGLSAMMLDGSDRDLRASRGNYGLVWVQGKGKGRPEYTQWSLRSAGLWKTLAADLAEETGEDLGLEQRGGVIVTLTEEEHTANARNLARIRQEQGNDPLQYSILDRQEMADLLPGLGPAVTGGSYSPHDGHANPLRLLRALHAAFQARGGLYRPHIEVQDFRQSDGPVTIELADGAVTAEQVVIAAGLGTKTLAEKVGLTIDIRPVHGQIIVTERVNRFFPLPSTLLRQTQEGVLMLGASAEDFGFEPLTDPTITRDIAWRCLRAFPFLADLRLMRVWGALRIMTGDGLPVYDRSTSHPGVHVVTCHSGVTLAAVHALDIPEWILTGAGPVDLGCFSAERFHVSAA